MAAFPQIGELEERRQSRVIVLGASQIEIDMLAPLYDTLTRIGHQQRLDVLIYSRGGAVNAARRVALLLDEFTEHLSFIVPHYCESAGTLVALAGREIIAGPTAVFSPIDSLLESSDASAANAPLALSCQDVRLFRKMSEDWFGLPEREARSKSLSVLCDSIFPTTLTSLYRCALEIQEIGCELLALHMREDAGDLRSNIVDTLVFGFHSHTYALTRDELAKLGLPLVRDPGIEAAAWRTVCELRTRIGPESRASLEDDWSDALIATREGGVLRRRRIDSPGGLWRPLGTH